MTSTSPISISSISSISPLGTNLEEARLSYQSNDHCFTNLNLKDTHSKAATLTPKGIQEIDILKNSNSFYKKLDNSVLYAIYASKKAIEKCQWNPDDSFGINIGSSRGATTLFENHHADFLKTNLSQSTTSPTTTLGNISSWVSQDLQSDGPTISPFYHMLHCTTCTFKWSRMAQKWNGQ